MKLQYFILLPLLAIFSGCVNVGDGGKEIIEPLQCTETYKYEFVSPDVPEHMLEESRPPEVKSWAGKTQKDVALHVIELDKALAESNARLRSVKGLLDDYDSRREEEQDKLNSRNE